MAKKAEGSHDVRQALGPMVAARVGSRRAMVVVGFIVQFGILVDELPGERVTMDMYAERWGLSRAQAFRHLGLFRRTFPDETFPARIWEMVRSGVETSDVDLAAAEAFVVSLPKGF